MKDLKHRCSCNAFELLCMQIWAKIQLTFQTLQKWQTYCNLTGVTELYCFLLILILFTEYFTNSQCSLGILGNGQSWPLWLLLLVRHFLWKQNVKIQCQKLQYTYDEIRICEKFTNVCRLIIYSWFPVHW
jgi:hypothetical protein